MVQQVKALAAKPKDLSSIPGTHVVKGKLTPSCSVLTPTDVLNQMCLYIPVQACTCTDKPMHKYAPLHSK